MKHLLFGVLWYLLCAGLLDASYAIVVKDQPFWSIARCGRAALHAVALTLFAAKAWPHYQALLPEE